jgi:sulfatase maturation enzyme AslB (radical SAM superfamily)
MNQPQTIMDVNGNFHHASGEDLFARDDAAWRGYRRKWKQWPETFRVGPFPLFLDVEVTSACNLRCPFCATTYRGEAIRKGFLDEALHRKIVDEGAERGLCGVKYNIRGEPLLHPKIDRFVAYAKGKGLLDVYFNTNAMLLSEAMAGKLIDAGLDRLSISAEGFTAEVYEAARVGASFETLLANLDALQALKARRGVAHPRVRVQTVMLPELAGEFEQYKAFWSQRVEEVGYLDYKEMKAKKSGRACPWACPQLWQRMGVWWDGTLLPCNHDDEAGLALGNVNDISIAAAWRGEALETLRRTHRAGRAHEIPVCDGCYLRNSEIQKHMQATE